MQKTVEYLIFAIAGLVLFSCMTYFALLYGVLGLFPKSLCAMVLLAMLVGLAVTR